MLLYFSGWIATNDFLIPKSFQPKTKVAVIVAARNEVENILNCVNDILKQNYPVELMELIVVDDFSSDKTFEILKSISDSRLKILQMKDFVSEQNFSSKKKSIETAIAKTTATLIVTTDADCRINESWVMNIVAEHELNQKQFILGPVAYHSEKNLFERMQSLDFFGFTGIACGSLYWKMPALCNGANLAYTRELFYQLGGFTDNEKIPSGDDMFLMMKAFKQNPNAVSYLKSTDATVRTFASSSWNEFLQQRIRWGSKSKHYSDFRITASLAIIFFFYCFLVACGVMAFFQPLFLFVFLFMVITKSIIDAAFLFNVANFFGRKKLLLIFLPAQIFHITYVLIAGVLSQVKTYNWKGRTNK
ncbi:glycosyl transferase [Bacteroidota bacterium]|nr:glycosyl transferase [Bacteroidota bacterium]